MKKTQKELVLAYLKKHKSMTSLDGQKMNGIMQMPKRIFDLRKEGWIIDSVPAVGKNRFGEQVGFVRYTLRGKSA